MSEAAGAGRRTPGLRAALLVAGSLAACLLLLELGCQLVGFRQLRGLEATRLHPDHYFQASASPRLAYELRRDFSLEKDGRHLHLNRQGIREDSDERFADRVRVALLGDSVVFGTALSQEQTLSAVLQQQLDPGGERLKFLNGGMPGFGLGELPEQLRALEAAYAPDAVWYLLNPNDFVIRDSIYEGADNGLYRSYRRPFFKSPWVIGKAVYRLMKGGVSPSTRWYRWTFEGTKAESFAGLDEIASIAREQGAALHVVFVPVRASYDPADSTIREIYAEVGRRLDASGIAWTDPAQAFRAALPAEVSDVSAWIDDTDHLTAAGTEVMAGAMASLLAPPVARPSQG